MTPTKPATATPPPGPAAAAVPIEERPSIRERARAAIHHPLFAAALCGIVAAGAVAFSARGCELHIPEPIQKLLMKTDEPRPVRPIPITVPEPLPPPPPPVRYVQEPAPVTLPPPKPKPPVQRCIKVNEFRICK
ncbi:hypothetical protein [Methylobacterium aquaticum]|uniref:hypothetical protein n=1 Tax=Methylobacterium aquaticum TaxID=270351 RepID=UPI0019317339|nr:hypothetical protein [Methylobacterium aquaticum]QRE76998.1 hypothetical protein F1D61_28695 [Methylobacterium aquaticum]